MNPLTLECRSGARLLLACFFEGLTSAALAAVLRFLGAAVCRTLGWVGIKNKYTGTHLCGQLLLGA
jgi:hypothetical protein